MEEKKNKNKLKRKEIISQFPFLFQRQARMVCKAIPYSLWLQFLSIPSVFPVLSFISYWYQ